VQSSRLKASHEIRVASVFRDAPAPFLNMILVHELAHLKEHEHNKAFYQLCAHMEPDYHQLEFDLRLYLTHREAGAAAHTDDLAHAEGALVPADGVGKDLRNSRSLYKNKGPASHIRPGHPIGAIHADQEAVPVPVPVSVSDRLRNARLWRWVRLISTAGPDSSNASDCRPL
jgi:hypothetical protein